MVCIVSFLPKLSWTMKGFNNDSRTLVLGSFLLLWATLSRLALGGSLNYIKTPFFSFWGNKLWLRKFSLSFLLWINFLDEKIDIPSSLIILQIVTKNLKWQKYQNSNLSLLPHHWWNASFWMKKLYD